MMRQNYGNISNVNYQLRRRRNRDREFEQQVESAVNHPAYLSNNPNLGSYIPQMNKNAPYWKELEAMPQKIKLAKELQDMFKPINDYRYRNHKYRDNPLDIINKAYNIKVDTSQWQSNRDSFSRLYKSLKNASISHQDILMMVGNPYAQTIQNWKNIPEARRQIIRKEYPEMDVATAAYLKWEAEHVRISNIKEGIDDCFADFVGFVTNVKSFQLGYKAWQAFKARKIVTTILNNAPKLEKATNKLLEGEGKVGSYGELQALNRKLNRKGLAAHHAPSRQYMKKYGVKENEGICINVEHPRIKTNKPGRHQQTRTYGVKGRIDSKLKPRDELAEDIKDMKQIYKKEGVYNDKMRDGLLDLIKQNENKFPELFKKGQK